MSYTVDQEVITPRGRGTVVGYSNNEYLINLHDRPGTGPFRYNASRLKPVPEGKQSA